MSKTRANKKNKQRKRHTRSQHGGIKVLLPHLHADVMDREIKTQPGLQTILSNTTNRRNI